MGALLDLALEADSLAPSGSLAVNLCTKDVAQRLSQAIKMLGEVPSRRAAYVAGEENGGTVPVTIVIRTAQRLVSGELAIPADRWDPWLFLRFLQEQDGKSA